MFRGLAIQATACFCLDSREWQHASVWTYQYDVLAADRKPQPGATGRDGANTSTTYAYDALGRLTGISYPRVMSLLANEQLPATTEAFNYDLLAKRKGVRSLFGRLGNFEWSSALTGATSTGPGTGIGYDGAGRIDDITHSLLGTGVIAGYEFTYDADSRITSIDSHIGRLMSYTYDNTLS